MNFNSTKLALYPDALEDWSQMVPKLNLIGLTKALAQHISIIHASFYAYSDLLILRFVIEDSHKILLNERHKLKLQEALKDYLNRDVHITIVDKNFIKKGICCICKDYGIDIEKINDKYLTLCPFHKESTPSFTIDSTSDYCFCLSCGKECTFDDFIKKRSTSNEL